jgi:hypothetical protein
VSAESALLRGRKAAEKRMVDQCTITRPGAPVTDPESGVVSASSETIYTGKCEVQSKNSSRASPEAGGRVFVEVSRVVKIPANAADVKDGDVVNMTASLLNAFTVGKKYRVEGFTPDSFDTAARLPVQEVTS